jgi:Rieske Fe-S protein
MNESTEQTTEPSTGAAGVDRRRLVTGVASAAVAAPLLAACGSSDGSSGSDTASGGGGAGGGGPAPAGGTTLGSVSQVPVGGGQVFPDQKVVVTQPSQGVWKAFSAVCTHAGCLVDQVADGTITCPCHLSKFSVADGSVQSGPAPKPLPPVKVEVKGGQATVA